MINNFLRCVASVRDCFRYLATSLPAVIVEEERNKELARLERKAKCLLPEFKDEIDTILFWKERQHLVVEKMKDTRESSEIAVLKAKEHKRELGLVRKANVVIQEFTAADKTLAALHK